VPRPIPARRSRLRAGARHCAWATISAKTRGRRWCRPASRHRPAQAAPQPRDRASAAAPDIHHIVGQAAKGIKRIGRLAHRRRQQQRGRGKRTWIRCGSWPGRRPVRIAGELRQTRRHRERPCRGFGPREDAGDTRAGMGACADEVEALDIFAPVVRPEPGALRQHRFEPERRPFDRQQAITKILRRKDPSRSRSDLEAPAAAVADRRWRSPGDRVRPARPVH
jgi:hypothetical protein